MEELIDWLNSIYPLSDECKNYLRSVIRDRTLKKGELLLKEGEICENLYFVQYGLLVCYYKMGRLKVTDWFFWEGETVVSVESFYDRVKSKDTIKAVKESLLYYIAFDELQYLYDHYLEFNYIGRVLTLKYFRIWHNLVRNTRLLTTEERYRNLVDSHPEILLRVPLKILATYFGMAPETISRLRS